MANNRPMSQPAAMTAYARQLAQGFRRLRFEPALEAEYQQDVGASLQARVRWAALLALAVWLGFSLFDLWRIAPDALTPAQRGTLELLRAVRIGVGTVAVCALLAALASPLTAVLRTALASLGTAMAFGAAYSVYAYKLLGIPDESSVLVLMMLALFLPLGWNLATQLLIALLYLGCVVGLALTAPLPAVAEAMLRVGAVLTLSLVVLSFGAYWREYLRREQFLYRKDAQWLALRDGLTGLYNRRMFTHHLEQALRQAQREARPLALMLLDVDHFKLYNDSHGHPAGDEVLRRLAAVLERCAGRPLDVAARLGGEEFALLLYDCAPGHARIAAQQLVDAVRGLGLAHRSSPVAPVVTVSAGAAMLEPGDQPAMLYSRADGLLYEAKHRGRDRCCWEREGADTGPTETQDHRGAPAPHAAGGAHSGGAAGPQPQPG